MKSKIIIEIDVEYEDRRHEKSVALNYEIHKYTQTTYMQHDHNE